MKKNETQIPAEIVYIALIYCRVSSERQAKEGHGIESQEIRCRQYANSKGYIIETKSFIDEGVSGGLLNRPAIKELLDYIDQHPFSNFVVIFDDLSRLARDLQVYLQLKMALKSRNCRLESPNFHFDESEENELMQNLTASFNQYERQKNRRQVIQKMAARLTNGCWPFCPPVGFKFTKNPEYGRLITPQAPYDSIFQSAFEKYANNELLTLDEVANYINTQYRLNGLTKKISRNGVRRILSNPLYAGYLEYNDWNIPLIKARHQGIISFELYNQILDKLNDRTKKHLRKDYRPDFPLRGYVVCHNCKSKLTASFPSGRNDRYPYYWCKKAGCVYLWKTIKKSKIEPEFENKLKEYEAVPQILDLTEAIITDLWESYKSSDSKLKQSTQNEITSIQDQINALVVRISKSSNDLVINEYENQLASLGKTKEELEKSFQANKYNDFEFGTALKEIRQFIESPYLWWKDDNYNNRYMLLQTYFEEYLTYDLNSGFGTMPLSLPAKVFSAKTAEEIHLVEMAGIEPASE